MIKESAPAKLNLYLEILDKRPDGYHNLRTVFQALDFCDELEFDFELKFGDCEELDFEISIDSSDFEVAHLGEKNSVCKAIEVFFSYLSDKNLLTGIEGFKAKIFIDKKIPIEAGLAGGSSNAAACLRALEKFFAEQRRVEILEEDLLQLALAIGSDVPFCLVSKKQSRVLAENLGEKFIETDLSDYDALNQVLIVKPDFGVNTAEAYKLLDEQAGKVVSLEKKLYFNSFEEVIFLKFLQLPEIKKELLSLGAEQVLLSGSGSALVGFWDSTADLNLIIKEAENNSVLKKFKIFTAKYL